MPKFKKWISYLLTVLIIACSITLTSINAGAKKSVGYKTSSHNILHIGKKYIISTSKGIFIKNSIKSKPKKLTSKKIKGNYVSNGKKIYFAVNRSSSKDSIYCLKISNKKLKKVKTVSYFQDFITAKNGCLYFFSGMNSGGSIYQLKTSTKSVKYFAFCCQYGKYFCGKIFSQRAHSDVDEYPLYSFDLKTGKKKTILKSAYLHSNNIGISYDFNNGNTENGLVLVSYSCNKFATKTKLKNIYTSTNGRKFFKSKKLKVNIEKIDYVNAKKKYAILSNGSGEHNGAYFKFNLKSGKSTYITSDDNTCEVLTDVNTNNRVYFSKNKSPKLSINILTGTKSKPCKINGKSHISNKNIKNFWIADKHLIVDKNGKLKTYKLSYK